MAEPMDAAVTAAAEAVDDVTLTEWTYVLSTEERNAVAAAAVAAAAPHIREQVARQIEAHADRLHAAGVLTAGCLSAARIAREGN